MHAAPLASGFPAPFVHGVSGQQPHTCCLQSLVASKRSGSPVVASRQGDGESPHGAEYASRRPCPLLGSHLHSHPIRVIDFSSYTTHSNTVRWPRAVCQSVSRPHPHGDSAASTACSLTLDVAASDFDRTARQKERETASGEIRFPAVKPSARARASGAQMKACRGRTPTGRDRG